MSDQSKTTAFPLTVRLRNFADLHERMQGSMKTTNLCREAADEIERLTVALAKARYRPMGDNHHNALLCPYCNPKGLRYAE